MNREVSVGKLLEYKYYYINKMGKEAYYRVESPIGDSGGYVQR